MTVVEDVAASVGGGDTGTPAITFIPLLTLALVLPAALIILT